MTSRNTKQLNIQQLKANIKEIEANLNKYNKTSSECEEYLLKDRLTKANKIYYQELLDNYSILKSKTADSELLVRTIKEMIK